MEVKTYEHCASIPEATWDSIVGVNDIFHTHRFLQALEASGVEDARYQYLMFYKNQKLAASAVLTVFDISLDLLVPKHKLLSAIKGVFPDFFKVKICFCGTPVSIGQRNLIVSDKTSYEEILPILDQKIKDFARLNRCKTIIFKEFYETEALVMGKTMSNLGYFSGYTLPYLKLPLRWNSFEAYQGAMRSNYRRQLQKSWNKISTADSRNSDKPHIEVSTTANYDYKQFYRLYESVMSRAAVKLETLNLDFFKHFFEKMQHDTHLISLTHDNQKLATHLMVAHGNELTFVWAGKPDPTSKFDDYFNLMAAMTDYAIKNKFKVLNFGQVAFYTKQRLGGEPFQLCLFFKSTSWFWHQFIKLLKNELFPRIELKPKNVFR